MVPPPHETSLYWSGGGGGVGEYAATAAALYHHWSSPTTVSAACLVTSNPRLASPKPTHHYLQVLEIALFDLLVVKSRPRKVVFLRFDFKIITQKVLSQIMNLN